MNYFRITLIAFTAVLVLSCGASRQSRYQQMNSVAMNHYLSEMVRKFDEACINALIFQVRPEADAFYPSDLEPWSRFLTGAQGKAPDDPGFDPLAFLTEECHNR